MSVNSISPSQPVQANQALKKSDVVAARKQAEILEADTMKGRKNAADQHARTQKAQSQQAQIQNSHEAKASVNTNGQKVGTLINTAA